MNELYAKLMLEELMKLEALKRVQEVRIDEFSRRKMIEDQDTIDELTIKVQELQNEINCMSNSRRLQGCWLSVQ